FAHEAEAFAAPDGEADPVDRAEWLRFLPTPAEKTGERTRQRLARSELLHEIAYFQQRGGIGGSGKRNGRAGGKGGPVGQVGKPGIPARRGLDEPPRVLVARRAENL